MKLEQTPISVNILYFILKGRYDYKSNNFFSYISIFQLENI
jgi:hypothetical protein